MIVSGICSITGCPPAKAAAIASYRPAFMAVIRPAFHANAPMGPNTITWAPGIAFPCASSAVILRSTVSPAFMRIASGVATILETCGVACGCWARAATARLTTVAPRKRGVNLMMELLP